MYTYYFLFYLFSESIFFATLSLIGISVNENSNIYSYYRILLAFLSIIIVFIRIWKLYNRDNPFLSYKKSYLFLSFIGLGLLILYSYYFINNSPYTLRAFIFFVILSFPAFIIGLFFEYKDTENLLTKVFIFNQFITLSFIIIIIKENGSVISSFNNLGGASHLTIGYTMALFFPSGFIKLCTNGNLFKKIYFSFFVFFNILICLLSGARGAIIAIFLISLFLIYKYLIKEGKFLIYILITFPILMLASWVIINNSNSKIAFWRLIYTFDKDSKDITGGRGDLYKIAYKMFQENLFLEME